MKPQQHAVVTEMFKAVLSGEKYASVADRHSVSVSTTAQIVKLLAWNLQNIVGVVGIDEATQPKVEILRANSKAYLEALEHYVPIASGRKSMRKAAASDTQIDHLVREVHAHSRHKKRDVALLLILFSTAAKPLEIARMQVRDFLTPNGLVREESILRAEAAINGRPRPIFFQSTRANRAINAYLNERIECGHGVKNSKRYRGLDPVSRLFLAPNGTEMPVVTNKAAGNRRFKCEAILSVYRKIFEIGGLPDISAMSARRTVAQKLKGRGSQESDIGKLLGLSEKRSVRLLLDEKKVELAGFVRELV